MSAWIRFRGWLRAAPALAVVGAAAFTVWRVRAAPVDVRAHTVGRGAVVREAFGTGLLESETTVDVGFDLPGRITGLAVDEGAEVRAGQVLGTIDGADLEGQLAVADANRRLAEQVMARSAIDVQRARTLWEGARTDLDRAEKLVASNVMSLAERDGLATRAAAAEAEYRAAVAGTANAGRSVDVARRSRGVAEIIAGRSRMVSPLDGIVVRRDRDVGAFVQPGLPVFRLIDGRRLRVRAWVDEVELPRLEIGQATRVVLRSDPARSYAGRVERIGREADRQTHEVLVDVALVEAPARFAVGQRADVFISTATVPDALRVPTGFCSMRERTCLVDRGGKAASVTIEPGLVGSAMFEVKSGLAAGDVVVAAARPGGAVPVRRGIRRVSAP